MSDDFSAGLLGVFLIAVVGFIGGVIGSITTHSSHVEEGRQQLRDEAVKANHAEYYIDTNNQRAWRWKETAK